MSFEEFYETKTELEISLIRLKRQRSAAFLIQKKIDIAEKLLAERAAILSSVFPCNDSRIILEDLLKNKVLLAGLISPDSKAKVSGT